MWLIDDWCNTCFHQIYLYKHTPWKINMEPTNHPFKGKMIFQASMIMFHVNLQGCTPNSERFLGGKNDFQLSRSPCPDATKIIHVFDHLKSFRAGEMVAQMSNYFVRYFHIYIYML